MSFFFIKIVSYNNIKLFTFVQHEVANGQAVCLMFKSNGDVLSILIL